MKFGLTRGGEERPKLTRPLDLGRLDVESVPVLLCYPPLCHLGIEFSAFSQHDGLVSSCEFASVASGMFPMALCSLSSL